MCGVHVLCGGGSSGSSASSSADVPNAPMKMMDQLLDRKDEHINFLERLAAILMTATVEEVFSDSVVYVFVDNS